MDWVELCRTATPDGGTLVLRGCGGLYEIRIDGRELMSNRAHRSEEALAELGCASCRGACHVLIGGLGMGYTLRAALDTLPATARVTVVELLPAVADWNRHRLAHLAGRPLADPRVDLQIGDVGTVIAGTAAGCDAILLDVDNGPAPLTDSGNAALYGAAGIEAARRALRPGGVLAVWSADPSPDFEQALKQVGFAIRSVSVSPRGTPDGPEHVIVLGTLPARTRST